MCVFESVKVIFFYDIALEMDKKIKKTKKKEMGG
jgi:hypothetical protein